MKKILLGTVVLVVLLAAGTLFFVYFNGSDSSTTSNLEGSSESRTFNPFGLFDRAGNDSGEENVVPLDESLDTPSSLENTRRLLEISTTPVSGVLGGVVGGEEVFRYVERATAHISDFHTTSSSAVRITNTTIPRIQRVVWGSLDTLALRYLNDTNTPTTFIGSITVPQNTSTNELRGLVGTFLPEGSTGVVFNETGETLLYLRENGGVAGVRVSLDGSGATTLFSSPIREWLIEWGRPQIITATTKPSVGVDGSLLFINANTGAQTPVLRDVPALTTHTNKQTTQTLFSGSRDGFVLHILNHATRTVLDTAIATLPEKCVWGVTTLYCAVPQTLPGGLPDTWYRGEVALSDLIWKIDTTTGFADFVFDPNEFGVGPLDAINLTLTPSEQHLAFIDKQSGSLWVYDLREDSVSVSSSVNDVEGSL